jgi:hypothetical protein
MHAAKATVNQLLRPSEQRHVALFGCLLADCFNSQGYQKGIRAFSAERCPQCQEHAPQMATPEILERMGLAGNRCTGVVWQWPAHQTECFRHSSWIQNLPVAFADL